MKKVILLDVTQVVRQPVEVEFPIYGLQDTSGEFDTTTIYYRVDLTEGGMRRTDVKVSKQFAFRREVEYEISVDPNHHLDGRCDLDYLLGRDMHKSSAEQFNQELAEAIAFAQALQ